MTQAGLHQRPAYFLYHLLWNTLDWVFPPHCGGCGKLAERWCGDCQARVERLGLRVCQRCGIPLDDGRVVCPNCETDPPLYQGLRSCVKYSGPARNAVIRLKYSRDIGLGDALAGELIRQFDALKWGVELVTCVPLSRGRLRERGYNQSAALARPVAMAFGLPFQPVLLRKTREAPSQVGLSASDRRKNVDGAFVAEQEHIAARKVLVIDDVTTTGSTIHACARALVDAGASTVYGLTFARAGLHDHNVVPTSLFSAPGGTYGAQN